MKSTLLWGLLAVCFCGRTASCAVEKNAFCVSSPDEKVTIRVNIGDSLTYSVHVGAAPLIVDSPLWLEFQDAGKYGPGMKVADSTIVKIDETWQPVWGPSSTVRDHYNELTLKLVGKEDVPAKKMDVVFRVYNDAAAFRYVLPEQSGLKEFVLLHENSTFTFAGNPVCWAANYRKFVSHQEEYFEKTTIRDLKKDGLYGLPLLVNVRDQKLFAAVTEAALTDWAGMYFRQIPENAAAENTQLRSVLSPIPKSTHLVRATTPHVSPWRVIMIGSTPGDLIESNVILNLNPPCALQDTSWIKPGRMAWDNWWSGGVKMDTATIKEYIRFAAEMGFEYQLIDWQWYGPFNKPDADVMLINPAVDMEEVLRFAKANNVKIWLWLYWSDIDRKMEEAFALYEKWGIAGVKIDFMQRDDQPMVNWYHNTVKLAAKHHLMVNFHGAYKPTGFRRTYPNLMTREGVLANEHARATADHNVTLPFTRMLAGPMDYTPGGFINRQPSQFNKSQRPRQVQTTRCQQLAMFVVYETPVVCVSDHPDNYKDQPGLEFLRMVPADWDETRVIDGVVGEYIVLARRAGNDWFLGAMTNSKGRTVHIPLDFLGSGSFQAQIFRDAPDADVHAEKLIEETRDVQTGTSMEIQLAPAGGLAIKFSPK